MSDKMEDLLFLGSVLLFLVAYVLACIGGFVC